MDRVRPIGSVQQQETAGCAAPADFDDAANLTQIGRGENHRLLVVARATYGQDFASRIHQVITGPGIEARHAGNYRNALWFFLTWLREEEKRLGATLGPPDDTSSDESNFVTQISAVLELSNGLRSGKAVAMDSVRFRAVCDAYVQDVADGKAPCQKHLAHGTRQQRVGQLSVFLQRSGTDAGFPPLKRELQFPSSIPKYLQPRTPTLAEITRHGVVDWSNPDKAAKAILDDALARDLTLSFAQPFAAVAELNSRRLASLRSALETEFGRWHDRFLMGKRALARKDLPSFEEWEEVRRRTYVYTKWLNTTFENDDEKKLGFVLSLMMRDAENGILPEIGKWKNTIPRLIIRFKILEKFTPETVDQKVSERLQAFVSMTSEAFITASGILLCDTGWNVQPLLAVPAKCYVGGRSADDKQIFASTKVLQAFKNRAKRDVTAILNEFSSEEWIHLSVYPTGSQKYSGIDVVEAVKDMTAAYRSSNDNGPLFLSYTWRAAATPSESMQSVWWRDFLKRIEDNPVIGGLPIQRRMIRQTILDINAMKGRGDHSPAQLLADHSRGSTTLQRYLRTPWFRRELMNHIRKFQNLLEAALLKDLPHVAAGLGISEEQLLKRQELANENGLGFVCLRPRDGLQPGTRPGRQCHRVDLCHLGCPARKFVPTPRALVALVLTAKSLRAAESDWIAQKPTRWAKFWLPLLAEAEAYISRLKDSSYRPRLMEAVAAVDQGLHSGDLNLIQPW